MEDRELNGHDILAPISHSLVRKAPRRGVCSLSTHGSQAAFFSVDYKGVPKQPFWRFLQSKSMAGELGCYIGFSGFSTSQVIFAQERKMYTTYVTARTADASKRKASPLANLAHGEEFCRQRV